MGGEQTGIAARLTAFLLGQFDILQFLVLQHAQDADDGLRIIIGARQILRTQAIGFEFVLTSVTGQQRAANQVGEVLSAHRADFRYEDGGDG